MINKWHNIYIHIILSLLSITFLLHNFIKPNLKPEELKYYIKAEHKCTFLKHKVIGFVPRALFEVKPHSYCSQIQVKTLSPFNFWSMLILSSFTNS